MGKHSCHNTLDKLVWKISALLPYLLAHSSPLLSSPFLLFPSFLSFLPSILPLSLPSFLHSPSLHSLLSQHSFHSTFETDTSFIAKKKPPPKKKTKQTPSYLALRTCITILNVIDKCLENVKLLKVIKYICHISFFIL